MSEKFDIKVVSAVRQRTWGLAAVINFWLGGMATGAYIIAFLFQSGIERKIPGYFVIQILFLLLMGFFLLTFHAGKPGRAWLSVCRFRSSWMARETVAGLVFFIAVAWYYFSPNNIAGWISLISALFFVFSQSVIPYYAKGIRSWCFVDIPILFFLLSFSSGIGLLLISTTFLATSTYKLATIACMVMIIFNAIIWILYLKRFQDIFPNDLTSFSKAKFFVFVVCLSMLFPFLLLLIVNLYPVSWGSMSDILLRGFELLTGLSLIVSAFLQRYFVIISIGWRKQMELCS